MARTKATRILLVVLTVSLPLVPKESRAATVAEAMQLSCSATAVRVLTIELVRANPTETPCRSESVGSSNSGPALAIETQVLSATTNRLEPPSAPSLGATSQARIVGLRLGLLGLTIGVQLLEAEAAVRCSGPSPQVTSSSRVIGLQLNGLPITSDRLEVALGLVTLRLNQEISTSTGVIRRALWLQTPLGDVVVGEASAGMIAGGCLTVLPFFPTITPHPTAARRTPGVPVVAEPDPISVGTGGGSVAPGPSSPAGPAPDIRLPPAVVPGGGTEGGGLPILLLVAGGSAFALLTAGVIWFFTLLTRKRRERGEPM
jgi:hypothetical protein